MSAFEWFSVAQSAVMLIVTILLGLERRRERQAAKREGEVVNTADGHRRLSDVENEIDRLRRWKHEIIVPWQQQLIEKLEERFVTRREWNEARSRDDDSPFPQNRRRNPR